MSTFPTSCERTTPLCTTTNRFALLDLENYTNSDAYEVRSPSASPPPLEPATTTPTSSTVESPPVRANLDDLLAAIDWTTHRELHSPSSPSLDDKEPRSTDQHITVHLDHTPTDHIRAALRALHYKRTCAYDEGEEEDERVWTTNENKRENREQRENQAEEDDPHPGPGWIETTNEPFALPTITGGALFAPYHKYHLDNPKYPLVSTTLRKGEEVFTTLLRPTPVPHKSPYLTPAQKRIFSGREPFARKVTEVATEEEDESFLSGLVAYRMWEREVMYTQQELARVNNKLAFQKIRMMEWYGALQDADGYRRLATGLQDYNPWGNGEQEALRQVLKGFRVPLHLRTRKVEGDWGFEDKEVPVRKNKAKKCSKCRSTTHYRRHCPQRVNHNQQRL
jgi:hypothetical protein